MRILYGVAGEGMGHAIRSKPIIEELSKKHNVLVVGGGKAHTYLQRYFKTSFIHCFNIIYRDNSVSNSLTFLYNLLKFPLTFIYNLKLYTILLKFKPDIIISDFEPFTNYLAFITGTPCVCIDNQHIMTNSVIDAKNYWLDKAISKLIIRSVILTASKYFVTTFFYPKLRNKKTLLFPAVLRNDILKAKPKSGKHILVYQTSNTNRELVRVLRKTDNKYIFYGLNRDKQIDNILFRKFNEKQFIKDLATCKAVIANGGFSLIGEALYLKKPMLCVPVRKQFEQILNAIYLQRLGYGKHCEHLTQRSVNDFMNNIKQYSQNLRKYKKEDNSRFMKRLNETIRELSH